MKSGSSVSAFMCVPSQPGSLLCPWDQSNSVIHAEGVLQKARPGSEPGSALGLLVTTEVTSLKQHNLKENGAVRAVSQTMEMIPKIMYAT